MSHKIKMVTWTSVIITPILPQDHCEATKLKKYPDPEANDANVDEVIRLVSEDSPACKEINFNNIQVCDIVDAKERYLFE